MSPPGRELSFVPGTPYPTGVLICADVDHPDVAAEYGAARTGLVLMPASDNGANGRVHARSGALRGVENGFAVAWAGQQGDSIIADRFGRVRAEASVAESRTPFTTLVADVPVDPGPAAARDHGDWFGWAALIVVALGLLGVRRRRSPERAAPLGATN